MRYGLLVYCAEALIMGVVDLGQPAILELTSDAISDQNRITMAMADTSIYRLG